MGLFGAFRIFDNFITRKQLFVEQNEPNFGPQRQVSNVYGSLLTSEVFKVILRSYGAVPIFNTLYLASRWSYSESEKRSAKG